VANSALLPSNAAAVGPSSSFDTLFRSALFIAVFLILWITFRPFPSLAEPGEVTAAGDLTNQLGYTTVFLMLAGWCLTHDPSRLALLVRPILVVTVLWLVLSVAKSWEPALAARRLAFTLVTTGIAAMVLLLPRNVRHFSDLLATAVLIVIALCYLGVLFAPGRAIHQATDFVEPELAGDWRGLFGHKNEASATMVLFVFVGLFVARVRRLAVGGLIVASAGLFLLMTYSKTSIAMLPIVLIISNVLGRIRNPVVGIGLALSVLAAFNLLSVGSIYFEWVRNLLDTVLADASFTGRNDVWQFAIDNLLKRPITGYGYSAFWGTEEVVFGLAGNAVWANTAGHAHNGYLDIALSVGIPGSLLVTLWLVVLPLVDYYRCPHEADAAPLQMLFLRVCLFAAYASCFESMLIETGSLGLFLIASAFALRFLSLTHVVL